ncbi:MAG TPA: hypothetical protein VKE88_02000 [Candidatus Nanoarchaeia archaeon]|nr:hypothetical protein [Candidatus Nanoarchaeia archaeon]
MAGLTESIGGFIPDINAGTAINVTLWVLGGILFGGIIAWIGWIIIQKKRFNKKLVLFREIGGKMTLVQTYLATFERIGYAGDFWCRTKSGKILKRPMYEISKDTYLYFEREDGEWINWMPENINNVMREKKVKFLDEDVRLARIAIERNLKDRFEKEGFWKKYGMLIGFGAIILIIFVFGLIMTKEFQKIIPALQSVADSFSSAATAFNNANVGSTGLVPASTNGAVQV